MFERLKRWLLPATQAEVGIGAPNVAVPPARHSVPIESPGTLLIDVRSEHEFHAAAIEHAVNVPLPQLAQRISEFVADKATPRELYCASGARSGIGRGGLKQLGYSQVTNAGGLYTAAERLQRKVRR